MLIDAVPAQLLVPEYSLNSGATWRLGPVRSRWATSQPGSVSLCCSGACWTPPPPAPFPIPPQYPPLPMIRTCPTIRTPSTSPLGGSLTCRWLKPARQTRPPRQLVTYTLAAANAGPSSAVNVVLEDPQPRFFKQSGMVTGQWGSWQPWTPSSPRHPAPQRSQVILLRGYGSASAAAVIKTPPPSTSDTPDPDPGNNTSSEAIPIEQSADLSVTKTGSPSPVSAGGVLTYTVELCPILAHPMRRTPSCPTRFLICSPAGSYSLDGVTFQPWTGILALGTFPAGSVGQYSCGAQRIRRPQVRCATQPPFPVIHPIRTRTTTLSPNAPRSIPPLT